MTVREHDEPLTLAAYAILNESGDQARNYLDALGLFERAERLGVEGLWVRQFHLRRPGPGTQSVPAGGLPSPLVFLAWLAARTSRLRLGTAAVTLPLESPLRVAEDAAVLDALSGGRAELGVANGGSAPGLAELFRGAGGAGAGDGQDARREAYQADLARLADVLDGARLDGTGAPLNPPSPGLADRIWEATLSEQSGYDTGARGHGVLIGTTQTIPAEVTARAYYRGLDRYQAGHGPRPPRVGIATLIYPAKDRETALREARAGIEEKYAWGRGFLPPATSLADQAASIGLHYGTAEQIAGSILAQRWFGYATQLMVQTELFYPSYAHRAEALELFTREVAPALGWTAASSAAPLG
jgi:alkanesulfonate monooxygenase SsuD/methylene tetrahydromethanopterin reductase-like flavin-dependent oxidoreductase (luciferase family)